MLEIIIEVCNVMSQSLPCIKPEFPYILILFPFRTLCWWNELSFSGPPCNGSEVVVQDQASNPAQLSLQVVCVLVELRKDKSKE